MKHLKRYESFSMGEHNSTGYYDNFSESDFMEYFCLSEPDLKYKRTKLVPGSNKIFLRFDLEDEQPMDNPYKAEKSEIITVDIGITYDMGGISKKSFVTIKLGAKDVWTFSWENGLMSDILTTDVKISDGTITSLKKILFKYS